VRYADATGGLPSVFLSYARGDDEQFVVRLREGLESAGASVWFDRVSLPSRALTFVQEIRDAIEAHDRMVVVVGPDALTSAYVEAEWRYALEAAKVVIPVVLSLPPDERIRDALPRDLNRLHVVDARKRQEDDVLAEVVRHLSEPAPLLGPLLHVPPPPPHYQPRVLDSAGLEAALQLDSPQRLTTTSRDRTLVIFGMGGVGKSVAAAAVARNVHVRRQFSSGVVWVDLGRDADILNGLRRVGAAVADDLRDYIRVDDTTARLAQKIGGVPLLVIADNVWSDDDLRPFVEIMGPATHLLVTTRDGGIGTRLGAVPIAIEPLMRAEGLEYLADWVGEPVDRLPESARTVAAECGGLPLALSLVGAMARGGTPWVDISAAIEEADLAFLAEQLPDYPYPDLLRALQISVVALENSRDDLERVAAACFRQLAAVRWDRPVPESTLITLWSMRAHLTQRHARRVLSVLVAKAFLRTEGEAPERVVSLHDLLHDFARAAVPNLTKEHGALLDAYEAQNPNTPFIADDGYFLDHFVYHLHGADRAKELPAILRKETAAGANAWWSVRRRHGQVSGYVADLGQAWRDASNAEDIGGLARWALMAASVRSAIGEVPANLATLLLKHGVWTPAQALAAADWAADRGRFEMLVATLPFVGRDQRMSLAEEAALLARREPEDADRIRRLLDLASALHGSTRRRFVSEAVPPHEPPSRFVDAWALLRVWRLDPERTDAADAAVAAAESRLDEVMSSVTVEHIAAEAPFAHLPRVHRMVDRLANPADRLEVLLALAERGYEPFDALAEEAEAEFVRIDDGRDVQELEARLVPCRPAAARTATVHHLIATRGEGRPSNRLRTLLGVLPYADGEDRDSAEREVFEILERADRAEAEALTDGPAARRFREADPRLFIAFIDEALSSVEAISDRWGRVSMLVRLLPHIDDDRARAMLEDEERRTLMINDHRDRAEGIAAYAGRLEEDAARRAVGNALRRMIDRLPGDSLANDAAPLLAYAAEPDIAALQTAVGEEGRFALDLRPALFGAWARHGKWEAAMKALDGGTPLEVERAVDPLVNQIPDEVAENLVAGAIELGDPDYYGAVVRLVPRLHADIRPSLLEIGFQAVEAQENPYDRLRIIERLAPMLPAEELPRIADLMPEAGDRMDRDQARLAIARAWIAHGDLVAAVEQIQCMEISDYASEAALDLADALPPEQRAGWLAVVEKTARGLSRTSKVKLLVAVARRSDEPKRIRLLREAQRAAEEPLEEHTLLPDTRADALRVVASAEEGAERERLLLEAWDAAPKGGAFSGIRTLTELAPLLGEVARARVRPQWERSLEHAISSRSAALQELTALADVVVALGGPDTAAEVATALDDVDRWWP
jgi:hypothetical protein